LKITGVCVNYYPVFYFLFFGKTMFEIDKIVHEIESAKTLKDLESLFDVYLGKK
jgi:hypothetical protein